MSESTTTEEKLHHLVWRLAEWRRKLNLLLTSKDPLSEEGVRYIKGHGLSAALDLGEEAERLLEEHYYDG